MRQFTDVTEKQFYKDLENVLPKIDELDLQADTCAAYHNTGLTDSPDARLSSL